MAFGTFDIVHPGHIFFLENAKKLGDYLVVVIGRDQTVANLKKHPTRNNELARQKAIQNLHIADKVLLGSLTDKFELVRSEQPDVIALGYDQTFYTEELTNVVPSTTSIIRVNSYKPEIYKSSKLGKNV